MPTDFGWKLPDIVWTEDAANRQQHLDWSTDVCYFREKWYMRGVLEIPFSFSNDRFGWGIWVETSEETIGIYRSVFDKDGSALPRAIGAIACKIHTYPENLGLPVEIQFGPSNLRPTFHLSGDSEHELAIDQRQGLSEEKYHAIVAVIAP